jgi:hypothetical protein
MNILRVNQLAYPIIMVILEVITWVGKNVYLHCIFLISIFVLWMSKWAHDVFVLIIDFMGSNWHKE